MPHLTAKASLALETEELEVVAVSLDAGAEDVCRSTALLSNDERQRAERFAFERDRRRFVVARAWLRDLLAARLDTRPESIALTYGTRGKPALAPAFADSDLRFNISHSGDVAVYAFAIGREVGIDVEAVRTISDADSIAARFFSRAETETYLALDSHERAMGFFNCWTRKEAFIKALGEGLSYSLDRFDVSLKPSEPAKFLHIEGTPGNECGWHMESFSPAPGFIAAVVIERNRHRSSITCST